MENALLFIYGVIHSLISDESQSVSASECRTCRRPRLAEKPTTEQHQLAWVQITDSRLCSLQRFGLQLDQAVWSRVWRQPCPLDVVVTTEPPAWQSLVS